MAEPHNFANDLPDRGDGGIENSRLVNGNHLIIKCSNCNKDLADIWVTGREPGLERKIVGECPHCGDKSFPVKVNKDFHIGITKETHHTDYHYDENNNILIKTVKA